MITITAKDASGAILAQACHEAEAMLCFDRDYAEGDCIEIAADARQNAVKAASATESPVKPPVDQS